MNNSNEADFRWHGFSQGRRGAAAGWRVGWGGLMVRTLDEPMQPTTHQALITPPTAI
ncbi:MAG: hypothetical protein LCH89_14950 [Proteobacteria bacterium]|nr:hypothetical protein [Pseudomonadota bacterium]